MMKIFIPGRAAVFLALGVASTAACGGIVVIDEGSGGGGTSSTGTSTTTGTTTTTTTGQGGAGGGTTVAAKCPEVAAESTYCLTTLYPGQIAAVGLESGNVCLVLDVGLELSDASSLAVLGDDVFVCSYEQGLIRISLPTASVTFAPQSCTAVAAYDGKLLVKSFEMFGQIALYASFEDAMNSAPEAVFDTDDSNTRMTQQGGTLYTAWHSTNEIDRWALPAFDPLPSIFPEGFDGWVDGMWVTPDGRLILATSDDQLLTFDIATGALQSALGTNAQGSLLGGLSCWSKL